MSWQPKSLDELGFVSRGRSRHRPRDAAHLYGGPHPFVQTGDVKHAGLYLNEYSQTYSEAGLEQSRMWPQGTLCITIAANIADTAILGIDACFPDSVIGFIPDESKADARFVKYLFDAMLKKRFKQFTQGAAQDNLSQGKLLSLKFPIPSVAEQRRIASVLSAYDNLIENNRRRIQLLEQAARLLYKEWFVHLRFPGHEHTQIIDGVPEGWSILPIKKFVEGIYDGPHATPPEADEGPIFLGIKSITKSGRLDLTSPRYITENDFPKWTRRVTPQAGDIVFSYEATLNLYALIPEGFRGCLGRRLALVRPIANDRTGLFIYFSFFEQRWRTVIEQNRLCGATVDRVPIAKFPDFPLLMPTRQLVAVFDEYVSPLMKQMEKFERQNALLTKARDLLLPKLMNRELNL